MKTKNFFLAVLAISILLSGCSKDEDVQVQENDLMKFYKSIEAYDGMTIQASKADLNDKGFVTLSHEDGYFEFEKTENNVTQHVELESNPDIDDIVYYISAELRGAGQQATMTQRSSFIDFVKCFGRSRKLPSNQKVGFYIFDDGDYETDDWSEMLNMMNGSSSMLNVEWMGEGSIECGVSSSWKNNSVSIDIYDGSYAPEDY